MSKNVLAILFSGQKNGNCSIMINEITKPMIVAGLNVELIQATSLNIRPCLGCFGCNNSEFKCVIKDDLETLKDKISSADMLLIVSPCYAFGPPSIMKNIIDRSAAWALDKIENGEKKKIGISVSIAGAHDEWCSMQKTTSSLFLKIYNCDVAVQKVYDRIGLKGEILLHPEILREGREIGEQTVRFFNGHGTALNISNDDGRLKCSVCKSDVFRILDKKYTCAVCGTSYDKTAFGIKDKHNTNKFTPEGASSHSEFIGGKIESGFAASDEIKSRLEKYLTDGEIPRKPYVEVQKPEDISIDWDEEGLAEFQRIVPKGFQKFVKKAVEKKAREQGYSLITKDVFLQIKKASGN